MTGQFSTVACWPKPPSHYPVHHKQFNFKHWKHESFKYATILTGYSNQTMYESRSVSWLVARSASTGQSDFLMLISTLWGRNSSVGSAWARCPQCHGFDSPQGTFSGRGDFSIGVYIGSNSIPPKTPSDESINRGLVCAHMHFIARTQKILTFMS